jgi:thiol-disulfide isomerase/thioredoxin
MTSDFRDFWQRLRLSGVVAALLLIVTASCGTESSPTPKSQTAASATGVSNTASNVLIGDVARIDSVLGEHKGRWVLVNVWATWCRPCVAETPDLVALHQSMNGKPFSLVGVSADYMTSPTADEALKKVRDFSAKYQIQYPNVIFSGSTDELTARFSLSGSIPSTILYNPQGEEVERWVGRLVHEDIEWIKAKVS